MAGGHLATARVHLSTAQIVSATVGPTGMATRWVTSVTKDIRNLAVLSAPVDTGRLRASILPTVQVLGMVVIGMVGSDVEYSAAVHNGLTDRHVNVRAHDRTYRKGPKAGRSEHVHAYVRHQDARAARPFLRVPMDTVLRARGVTLR